MDNNAREVVLTTLLDIEKNSIFSNTALGTALRANQFMSKQDRAYITRMVEGVTEKRITLDYIIDRFSKTKVKKCKPFIRCVLRMGTYELFYMDSVSDYTTCNLCVDLTIKHGFKSLKGYVNGVLRSIARNKNSISFPDKDTDKTAYLSVKYSVPEELVSILMEDYDLSAIETIFESGEKDRPTAIRVNTDKISVDKFKKLLDEAGIRAQSGALNDTSLLISGYDYIRKVPGYMDGYFTVQDQSSCIAVRAADIKEGDLVVDVCAAPGGKTMYASFFAGEKGRVISRDVTDKKTELISDNVERLGLNNVFVEKYDARELDEELIGKADCVIADLPCSGLGIMGRKNDIKYNVSRDKIDELVLLQRQILDVVSQYVKPGGTLVYSTCTIDRKENAENSDWFVRNHDFEYVDIDSYLPEHGGDKGYITMLQGFDECDGFFVARFKRKG